MHDLDPIAWTDAWCAWCGETLPVDRDPRRKFCNNHRACETAYHNDKRARRLAEGRAGRTCKLCSKPFDRPKSHSIYCSRTCACRASRLRRRAK